VRRQDQFQKKSFEIKKLDKSAKVQKNADRYLKAGGARGIFSAELDE
jgi:hypothetical protein